VRVLKFFLLALVLIVSLSGCEELFEFNLFASLDTIDLPDAEALNGMGEEEALDYLDEELESDAFVDALAEDQQALNDVETYLNDHRGTAGDDTEKRATILYADLQLKVYKGEELVNNALSLLLGDPQDVNFSDVTEVEDFLKAHLADMVPPESLASREVFDAMLSGFQAAWDAYAIFAASLDGNPDTDEVPDSINMGDVAQKALVACIINEAIDSLYVIPDPYTVLWNMANGDPAEPADGTFADPFADGGPVDTIFDEAGISFS